MGDQYDALAAKLGIPLARIPDWRKMAGAPSAPMPQAPSYEGATLQGMASQTAPLPPIGPPKPTPSYEGATLQGMAPTGITLADPIGKRPPPMRLATGDNLGTAPAAVRPGVMAQMNAVADNSSAATNGAAKSLADNANKKNLEGATFHQPDDDAVPTLPGGAPILVDKGGRRPAAWEVQEGQPMSDEANLAVYDANARGHDAADLDYEAGKKAADYERGFLDRHNQAAAAMASEDVNRSNKYAEQVDSHMQTLDQIRGQIRESKIDPYDGMNPVVAKIGQSIAMALGAFASKHGENAGLEAVKFSMAAGIDRQEKELQKLQRGAAGEVNFLGQLKEQFGDVRAAKAAAYVSYLEAAKVELAKNLGDPSVADPRLLAGYERLNAKLDDELVHREAAFNAITKDKVVRHDVNAQPKYIGGTAAIGALDHKQEENVGHMTEALVKSGIPGAREDLNRLLSVIPKEGEIRGVGGVQNYVPDRAYDFFGSEQGHEIRQAASRLFNRQLKDDAGAAVSDQELKRNEAEFYGAKDAASARRTLIAYANRLNALEGTIRSRAAPDVNAVQRQRQSIETNRLQRKSGFTGPGDDQ